tara:strand:- start:118 stop:405 length:288 start_codon:yes stop_codon:yes gene_type:complete
MDENGEWKGIAGCDAQKIATIMMCGGCAEWWNYVLIFKDGDYILFVEDRFGRHKKDLKLIYHIDEEEVKEVYDLDTYELQDDELIIDIDFFCWDD